MVLTGLIVAIVVGALVADDDGEQEATPGTAAPPATATSPTTGRGFPAAGEESVCRTLVTNEEAESLVGRELGHPVIEPQERQCAWPAEEGTPLDAELFFEVLDRESGPLRDALEFLWTPPERFRFEEAGGLGDEAAFVVRVPQPGEEREAFVAGLHVYTGPWHVVLGNGARDIWEGTIEEVKSRLRETMERVLPRVEQLVSDGPAG